ncbi:arachidonate 15-lipoxygenase [Enterovibrio norvegicus]|uniref:lipoxygenase family protein n=1 Tax=Enterovibrio norvegicus TaxID=188144 RepID=UPI0002EB1276|nr:lipoxygenase family protein [Enterovibrio norvegicus]OEE43192.1 arachidonate 15-lipoxygenase [Enterovibrio norvegicus]
MHSKKTPIIPSLPQGLSEKDMQDRAFQVSVSQASYNYMFSYLEPLSLSAGLPEGEAFTLEYEAKVTKVFLPLLENFTHVVLSLLEREIEDDLTSDVSSTIKKVNDAYLTLKAHKSSSSPLALIDDVEQTKALLDALVEVPNSIEAALKGLSHLPKDLANIVEGLSKVTKEFESEGFTAFLKNTLYYTLNEERGRDYLQAKGLEDYELLFNSLPTPQAMDIERKAWMPDDEQPICLQDWYFGYMQIAGFNTTNLRGVRTEKAACENVCLLSELLEKMSVTDDILQNVSGDITLTLTEAANKGLLYVCDYAMFEGKKGAPLHGLHRYPEAPIALFYWSASPPSGFPTDGALQPIAIQLGQHFDADTTPIFTPNDCTNNNDCDGAKWLLAKMVVQNACTIEHETIAHLGACHLVIEPIIVASHRQLPQAHPLMVLLKPHFRFTLNINNGAYTSLMVPGGVVASVISTSHQETGEVLVEAYEKRRFDDQYPDKIFGQRGVEKDTLPSFPFREDTMDLWASIHDFVVDYLSLYYEGRSMEERNNMVLEDVELQAWVNELVNPKRAAVKGLEGLTATGDDKHPVQIDDFDYLCRVVAQIIYTASAQHASVNFAQYPLMSYIPGATGTLYKPMPGSREPLRKEDVVSWLPPLDVALYQTSFAYLLAGVQYDTLGHYTDDPRIHYFTDKRVAPILSTFHMRLNKIEIDIHQRNASRPMPYMMQLPSLIPNSISI